MREVKKKKKKNTWFSKIIEKFSDNSSKLNKVDYYIIVVLVIIYSFFGLYRLGSFNVPQTYYKINDYQESIDLSIKEDVQHVSKMIYYTGPATGEFTILTSDNGIDYTEIKTFNSDSVFVWKEEVLDVDLKYIRLIPSLSGYYIGDIQLFDANGNKLTMEVMDNNFNVLVDELDTIPDEIGYMNSTYFDEIYFGRSAWEYVHGVDTMEWTHPPLGKLIIAIPILLFGFSPFAFRIMGVIAGIIMVPVIYILAKRLFKNRKWALLAGILLSFDNFHLAQTRLGTADGFLVLFIMLSVLFMKDFIDLDNLKEDNRRLKTIKLLLSGLFIGLAVTTKWTATYAMLGLAIVFFVHLFKKYETKENSTKNNKKITFAIIAASLIMIVIPLILYFIISKVGSDNTTTLMFIYYIVIIISTIIWFMIRLVKKDNSLKYTFLICVLSFIVIPVLIYVLSYMLFPKVVGYNHTLDGIITQIQSMYNYHSTLSERHPFESSWYQWPIMYKPVWYYVGYYTGAAGESLKSTIVGIGNPAIWWLGIIATIYLLIQTIIKKDHAYFFILVFILCTYLPYIFIGRAMFMYHFFPTIIFIILAIVAFIKWLSEIVKNNSIYIIYIVIVIAVFLTFYPVTVGVKMPSDVIDSLKWLSSWIF